MKITIDSDSFDFDEVNDWMGPLSHLHKTGVRLKPLGTNAKEKTVFAKRFPRRPGIWDLLQKMQSNYYEWTGTKFFAPRILWCGSTDSTNYGDNRWYIVAEHVPGKEIDRYQLPITRLPLDQRARIAKDAFVTLRKLVDAGCWYTDLHPKNVILHPTPAIRGTTAIWQMWIIDVDSAEPHTVAFPSSGVAQFYTGEGLKGPLDGRAVNAYQWAMFASHALQGFPGDQWSHAEAQSVYGDLPDKLAATFERLRIVAETGAPFSDAWRLAGDILNVLWREFGSAQGTALVPAIKYRLTVNAPDSAVKSVQLNHKNESLPINIEIAADTIVTIASLPLEGSIFKGWKGDFSSNQQQITFRISKPINILASYEKQTYSVRITITNGRLKVIPKETGYSYGELVPVEVAPDDGYYFDCWKGNINDSYFKSNPITLSVTGDFDLSAQCELKEYRVDASANRKGRVEPASGLYKHGQTVRIKALAPPGAVKLSCWQGAPVDARINLEYLEFEITSYVRVEAVFVDNPNLWATEALIFALFALGFCVLEFVPQKYFGEFLGEKSLRQLVFGGVGLCGAAGLLSSFVGFAKVNQHAGEGKMKSLAAAFISVVALLSLLHFGPAFQKLTFENDKAATAQSSDQLTAKKVFAIIEDENATLELIKENWGRRVIASCFEGERPALHVAVANHEAVALAFLRTPDGKDLLINTKGPNGASALSVAIQFHDSVGLELLKTPEDRSLLVSVRDSDGNTLLHYAATSSNASVIRALLKTKEGRALLANTTNSIGGSVLHFAAACQESLTLELLSEKEGRHLLMSTKDSKGASALDWALIKQPDLSAKLEQMSKDTADKLLRTK